MCLGFVSVAEATTSHPPANIKPIANAGPDQTVGLATLVKLDGSQSSDPDGSIVKYAWSQTGGSHVTLAGANTATPSFTTPATLQGQAPLVFKLTVTDNKNATGTDTVKITLKPLPPPVKLKVSKTGGGEGKVTSSPAGINCGLTCSFNFAVGTPVTLTATPDANSIFTGWSGACNGSGGCALTMDAAKTVSANFDVAPKYKVTVSKTGPGKGTVTSSPAGINCGPICVRQFKSGTAVTLTVTPGKGSVFIGWMGACTGTATTCTVSVTQNLQVGVTFIIPVLNDTGITSCSDDTTNGLTCPQVTHPGQDAEYGRDKTNNDSTDGLAGFSFTKISSAGAALPADATSWDCVRDNVTGLVWEVKTDNTPADLHDKDWTYTWFQTDPTNNGGDAGTQNGGTCSGSSSCDTSGYVQAVNAAGWCGFTDWRMPTVDELSGIAALDRINPAIDTAYFPNTNSAVFWSSSPNAYSGDYAWYVYFGYGYGYVGYKSYDYQVRLVRSGQ